MQEITEFEIPGWKGKFRWTVYPKNWVTRLLWKFIKYEVTIDYLQGIKDK